MGDEISSTSLEQYLIQLKQVENALEATDDPEELQSLLSLLNNLKELIDLCTQTPTVTENEEKTSARHNEDDEMALFMSEIKKLESQAETSSSNSNNLTNDKTLKALKDELQSMIGRKCSAPHKHKWGTKTYHNAIVCGYGSDPDGLTCDDDIKDYKMRILFTNPTHKEMVPCSYYLDGDCKFNEDQCRFSHGELIAYGELKNYQEPDFTQLRRNCVVLAKLPDRIWHKGKVLHVNANETSCRVKLEHQKKEIDCEFEDLFPIFHDDDDDDEDDFSSDSSSSDHEDSNSDMEDTKKAQLIQQSLFTPAPDRKLGEWEKHTKGIGSKLMQKMGYIIGTGLGTNGEGIIVPISAQILPPGRSLDHCMELREAANGDKDLFSVEKKLHKEQKKQEALNAKAYERESKIDVFSFLNESIFTNDLKKTNPLKATSDFKAQTTKNLNVESVKIADDIRKKQKEIIKIKEAMKRHNTGSDMHKRLQGQLAVKTNELSNLKKSENSLTKEQRFRKDKSKLSIF